MVEEDYTQRSMASIEGLAYVIATRIFPSDLRPAARDELVRLLLNFAEAIVAKAKS